jgi:hypothetical protein
MHHPAWPLFADELSVGLPIQPIHRSCMYTRSTAASAESSAGRTSKCMPMGFPGSGAAL